LVLFIEFETVGMKYSKVYIEALGYELAPVVVTSSELEQRLESLYRKVHIAPGQLEALTGIRERRWWLPETPLATGAVAAAKKALAQSELTAADLGALVYTGVCREDYEPATACGVAAALGVRGDAAIFDISNACLGVLNGILDIANRIELGQIKAGLVVACESSREINEIVIAEMLEHSSIEFFSKSLATLTGGSGAAAVLLTDGSFTQQHRPQLLGAVTQAEPQFNQLCRWGISKESGQYKPYMRTDAVAVMKNGIELGKRTWDAFTRKLALTSEKIDRVICHQVGEAHQKLILQTLDIDPAKDFPTFEFLGNMGTVSLPITASIAAERDELHAGDLVGFLGIGSGLNCMMMAIQW
jgi:3-oxoacyl-[acyl-carrier-protein] synthase-3